MGKTADLIKAADAIRQALSDFVAKDEKGHVHIFESYPGHLRAVVGSDRFKDMGVAERQNTIWKHMKDKVAAEALRFCWGIHPMDLEEYAEEFPQSISSSAKLFIEGTE